MRLNTRRRTAVATTTGLPRYARNDKVGTQECRLGQDYPLYSVIASSAGHPELVEGRGNLDEVEHTSANRRCYDDGIATLRSQ